MSLTGNMWDGCADAYRLGPSTWAETTHRGRRDGGQTAAVGEGTYGQTELPPVLTGHTLHPRIKANNRFRMPFIGSASMLQRLAVLVQLRGVAAQRASSWNWISVTPPTPQAASGSECWALGRQKHSRPPHKPLPVVTTGDMSCPESLCG